MMVRAWMEPGPNSGNQPATYQALRTHMVSSGQCFAPKDSTMSGRISIATALIATGLLPFRQLAHLRNDRPVDDREQVGVGRQGTTAAHEIGDLRPFRTVRDRHTVIARSVLGEVDRQRLARL